MHLKIVKTSKAWQFLFLCISLLYINIINTQITYAFDNIADLNIIYISNMPNVEGDGEIPSLAKVATFIKAEREKHPNLIFLHGGDSLAPSILSSLDSGAHIIDLLNTLNPDLMAISKREFSFGEDTLILRSQEALFPFVSNNIKNLTTGDPYPYFEESVLLEVNGIKVGIISSTSQAAVSRYAAKDTLFFDVTETIKRSAEKLRQQGANIIISMYDDQDKDLVSLLDDGHVDILFETSFYQDGVSVPENNRFLHHDLKTGYISRLDITFDQNAEEKVQVVKFERVDISNLEEDTETQALVKGYVDPLNMLLDMKLGHFTTNFSYSRDIVRTGESAFANFIVDVMRDNTKSDLALLNSGSIRGSNTFNAGELITRRDIQRALPFRNAIVTIEVTGQQIVEAIEKGLGCMEISAGCGTNLSNVHIKYDNSKPVGQRIVYGTIGGEPILLDKKYTMTTTNYIASGGDGLFSPDEKFKETKTSHNTLLWEIVSNYIFQHQNISPAINGRLTKIN